MEFKKIQEMVYEPYIKLGFFDQWNMTELISVIEYLEIDNAFMSAFPKQLNILKNMMEKLKTIMEIGEVGLFGEEQGELFEAIRKGMPLSHPFKIKGETTKGEECADLFIRLSCYCLRMGIDLENEIIKKHEYNSQRAYLHGKKA